MLDITPVPDRPPTLLESALRADRWAAAALLLALPLGCWTWIVVMARDMYGPMSGASAWTMTAAWDVRHLLLLWAMWAAMMAGMMLPSAAPLLLLYGAAARRRAGGVGAALPIYALGLGYLSVWLAFSVAATALQRLLASLLMLSPMMGLTSATGGATVLLAAGLYQLTPLKRACLQTCQSPLGFLMRRWRAGTAGAFSMGARHGGYCLGCCWALMLLLFVGGVMNLVVIAGLTALVAFEKLGPPGPQGARISGALLILGSVWMFSR